MTSALKPCSWCGAEVPCLDNACPLKIAAPVASDAGLRAERDRYKQALEFYADKENWETGCFQHSIDETLGHNALTLAIPDAMNDQGKTARAALNPSEQQT